MWGGGLTRLTDFGSLHLFRKQLPADITMIQLTQEQKELVRQWVTEGAKLSEIQTRISNEFKIPVTFIDVRFLVIDLGLNIKENEKSSSGNVDLSKPAPSENGQPDSGLEQDMQEEPAGGVAIELDRVVKPGAIASGSVRFSDGQTASWMLDQMGRVGLTAAKAGYRPSQEDLQAFQQELARLLQSRGF